MTDDEKVLKLQAFFDGELTEAEAGEVAAWLARDREAADLHKELRNTRQAMAGFEREINLPESREFYWSKIARQIEGVERVAPVKTPVSPLAWLRRLLLPAVGLAAVVAAFFYLWQPTPTEAQPEFDCANEDCGATTYRDEQAGVTVIWYSYDSEAQQQGQHAAESLQNQ